MVHNLGWPQGKHGQQRGVTEPRGVPEVAKWCCDKCTNHGATLELGFFVPMLDEWSGWGAVMDACVAILLMRGEN